MYKNFLQPLRRVHKKINGLYDITNTYYTLEL